MNLLFFRFYQLEHGLNDQLVADEVVRVFYNLENKEVHYFVRYSQNKWKEIPKSNKQQLKVSSLTEVSIDELEKLRLIKLEYLYESYKTEYLKDIEGTLLLNILYNTLRDPILLNMLGHGNVKDYAIF